ncbi:beta-ketoacyl-ACP synthase II [Hydrogenophaga sp. RWCD_12]|uniref:beta-ketoacyl-ACP synthase II n=1 Tax=Hydrogenophaga sp. RWCD_12 TaxID=3391190 RepID=UPI003984D2AB
MSSMKPNTECRVVITGRGMVSPLGVGKRTSWLRLVAGESGVRALPTTLSEGQESRVAGLVQDRSAETPDGFDPGRFMDAKDIKKADRFIHLALAAADEALKEARWPPIEESSRAMTATVVASGVGGFPAIADAVRLAEQRGVKRLSPFTVPSFLINLAAGHISIRYGFRGPVGAPATACAASVQAIGDAARLIRSGEADVVLCGGSESTMDPVTLGAFSSAKALSTSYNDTPATASRPFDQARDGFVLGEGAAMLVLESLDHALKRGATPIAEVLGYGTSADAFHITASPPDGSGMVLSMSRALAQANILSADIDYISAHATSTPVGDAAELRAIHSVFHSGARAAVSSVKGALGHLLGAAGATATIFATYAMQEGLVPLTCNLSMPDAGAAGLDLVYGTSREMKVNHALVNGFGFGGVNASLVLRAMS